MPTFPYARSTTDAFHFSATHPLTCTHVGHVMLLLGSEIWNSVTSCMHRVIIILMPHAMQGKGPYTICLQKRPRSDITVPLRGLDTLGRVFHHIFENETTYIHLSVCVPAHQVPSEKGSILKGKNLLPQGANSFLL